jgi:hypothetical protein
MLASTINIRDNATPAIEEKLARVNPERLAAEIAPGLQAFWNRRLYGLGTNKAGFPSTGFWEAQADSVIARNLGSRVELTAGTGEGGIVQRLYGGPIRFTNKAGTIPIDAASYGKLAGEFTNLVRVRLQDGRWFLCAWTGSGEKPDVIIFRAKASQTHPANNLKAGQAKPAMKSLVFLFRLIPKGGETAPQAPNPAVMPTDDEFTEVALAEIDRRVK